MSHSGQHPTIRKPRRRCGAAAVLAWLALAALMMSGAAAPASANELFGGPTTGFCGGLGYEEEPQHYAGLTVAVPDVTAGTNVEVGDFFGQAVDYRDGKLVVGAPELGGLGPGRVEVFNVSGGDSFSFDRTINTDFCGSAGEFGSSVALGSDDMVAIGGPGENGGRGLVEVHEIGGSSEALFAPFSGATSFRFGTDVAYEDSFPLIAVGVPGDDGQWEDSNADSSERGSVIVYTLNQFGSWSPANKLLPDPDPEQFFGAAVAMDSDGTVVVGGVDDDLNGGSASIYRMEDVEFTSRGEPDIATHGVESGDFPSNVDEVTVWQGAQFKGSGEKDIIGRISSSGGDAKIHEFRINTYTTGDQTLPKVAKDDDGDFFVVWEGASGQDGDGIGVFGRLYDSNGRPQTDEMQVNTRTSGDQKRPDVARNRQGDTLVVWESPGDGDDVGVFGQLYDGNGNEVGSEFQLNTTTNDQQRRPKIVTDTDGDFIAVWESQNVDGDARAIVMRRFNDNALPTSSEIQVNSYTTNSQADPDIAVGTSGDFVIIWSSRNQDGDGFGIFGQRYNEFGSKLGSEFQASTYTVGTQHYGAVAVDDDDEFLVTWRSRDQDGDAEGVYAQLYNSNGTRDGGEFRVNSNTTGRQSYPAVLGNTYQGFTIVWRDGRPNGEGARIGRRGLSSNFGNTLLDETYVNSDFDWVLERREDQDGEGAFGSDVDIDSGLVVIASPDAFGNDSEAYTIREENGSYANSPMEPLSEKLEEPTPELFGFAVAVDENFVHVSAPTTELGETSKIYPYKRAYSPNNAPSLTEDEKIQAQVTEARQSVLYSATGSMVVCPDGSETIEAPTELVEPDAGPDCFACFGRRLAPLPVGPAAGCPCRSNNNGSVQPEVNTDFACGNARIEGGNNEECDDKNSKNGDGCTKKCKVENGWDCTGEPSCCVPICGDDQIKGDEECDGDDLGGDTCTDLGFDGGTLGCGGDCLFDVSDCYVCGDGSADGPEECDDGNSNNNDLCRNDCTLPVCGDGIVDSGEDCDDGNTNDTDGCRNNCTAPECGDGIVDSGEECDDGNTNNADACRNDCSEPVCGDGIIDAGEACDDGNNNNDDDCRNDCVAAECGDGIVDSGEQCDDGNNVNGDGCQADCQDPVCGDAIVDAGEECDDGNTDSGDGCQADCMNPVCGDGTVDPGEECDDGNNTDGDGCQADCDDPFCGDGIVDPGESCDDGNATNGDGCESDCSLASCGNGTIETGEECDDGNDDNDDDCRNNCTEPVCGDGVLDAGEGCDDGNTTNGDGCNSECVLTTCGNGAIDPGEECDGANLRGRDCRTEGFAGGALGCSAGCVFDTSGCNEDPTCGDGFVNQPSESCDGSDLAGQTCADEGFISGQLACDGSCDYDTSGCSNAPGECGQPVSLGTGIVANDCLYILRSAIALESCALCRCDVTGNGAIAASDALGCLNAAVGLDTNLNCPVCE